MFAEEDSCTTTSDDDTRVNLWSIKQERAWAHQKLSEETKRIMNRSLLRAFHNRKDEELKLNVTIKIIICHINHFKLIKIVCGIYSDFKTNGRSKTFSKPCQARTRSETTSVFALYYIYRFENILYISFYNKKTQKIIYIEPTLVLTWVCPTWATTCRHPNHSSRAITSHTASIKWK